MPGHAQTLRPFLSRTARLYPDRELVARRGDSTVRYTYATYADRVDRLASALRAAGIDRGDRVGTLCWNHDRHAEAYFAVPNLGAQLHTVNPLLPAEDIQRVVSAAGDRLLIVDASLAETLVDAYDPDAFESVDRVVVVGADAPNLPFASVSIEDFLAGHDAAIDYPDLAGDDPAGLCYSSGTTGDPKGVAYSQRMLWSHTMAIQTPMGLDIADADVVMPVVPMFHINAWGLPYAATAAGAKHVYPGPSPDPEDLVTLVEEEGVTLTAGVPTVWLGVLDYLQDHDADLSSLERIVVGGAAPPTRLIRAYDEYGVEVVHGWGMTETAPVGAVSHLKPDLRDADAETRVAKQAKQGLILPGLEFRVVDDDGDTVPHDGESMGELLVRGPWVTTEYYDGADPDAFEGSWLRTGDVVTIDADGYVELVDRAADVINSGGEWISSQALETAIMDHDAVREAAVVGIPHERWGERPVAYLVADATDPEALRDDLCARLSDRYPDWWVPDRFEFLGSLPKTATGKFDKVGLRGRSDETLSGPVDADPPDGDVR
ncbi:fatty-acyl-CoA synthase [Haloplanus vescus]|uniref:Fatty-acyl-CoA synthase n=1 Tax=Haloplanus vescus TaxID=555874 RepID=A0A1H3W4S6_9EURY|nr:long-chain fatty acid--CoA ligase [Haloplanus vescus]SDZ82115.1 fatty-acyl-CoA synthase [Haloplanus vescus]